ncbi:MAG: error-prone DNA polymerase, partial [Candidatus Eisenbacteria bacterium]|nr:error-prone DNA polymerase [Candidatus Eisenbacteria bacterium]
MEPGTARVIPLPQAPPLTLSPPRGIPLPVQQQLERELAVISELDYEGYFLTMWEVVRFCRRENILCQGRGSAANSAVCYCLGITAIDPVRMGLLFERFLSRERAEPPDIDLDIEHNRREEVIQWVYRKYGRTHAAMVANFIRFRTRSAVREVGKVLGFAETEVDRLAKLLPHYEGISTETLQQAGFDAGNPMHQHLLILTMEIQDFPRHLSIHPGGFLLGHEPVARLVPTENATMEDRTVIQWDKEDLENLGLFKIDLLGLGALHQLHLAFDLLRAHWGRLFTMANIPADDPPTFDMICKGDTIGVFQIESRAQMAMLPRLRPRNYYDLVIEVSIVRPGPISGGMVHPYLRRRTGKERIEYPHASLEPVLKKTLGVPLFQEQVMQLAVVAADYTPGEADQLRRDMAAWRSSGRIERHRERLISRMKSKGIAEEFAIRVFEQIRGFGEYGFPESHAASFALIAYATAWVRRHYPDVFTCALLNAQPMGFYTPATIIEDAKRHGVLVLPVDIATSAWHCTLELPNTMRPQVAPNEQNHVSEAGGALGIVEGTCPPRGNHLEEPPDLLRASGSGGARQPDRMNSARAVPRDDSQGAARRAPASGSGGARQPDRMNSARAVPRADPQGAARRATFAVRLGLRYSKGMGERERAAIESARADGPFRSIEDFAHRTRIDAGRLTRLAESGAFACFEPRRRNALWQVRAVHPSEAPELGMQKVEQDAAFAPLTSFETIVWDYETANLSTQGHPLEPMRAELAAAGLPDARTVNAKRHGTRVRYAGV